MRTSRRWASRYLGDKATGKSMKTFIAECRRRQLFQVVGLYIVSAWVVLQVAALAFDNWGVPSAAMRFVWIGAVSGLPIALVLGWRFDIRDGRVFRTADRQEDTDLSLRRSDYLFLGVATGTALAITGGLITGILQTRTEHPEKIGAATIDPQSIAVLPFDDMSPDGDQAHISDGISEEILHWLAAYQDLKVTSRTSAAKVHEAGLSVPEVAAELGVAYVLEGSVRKSGDLLRITAQLIDARADAHVWSEEHEYELEDIFGLYDQVSARIARQLQATLHEAAPVSYTIDAETYDLYLQGRRLLARRGPDNLQQAIELFEQVVKVEPSFAPGYAALAQAHFWKGPYDQERLDRMTDAAGRALELDPDSSEALTVKGKLLVQSRNFGEGRKYLERAIETDANNALAYRWLGQSYQNSDPARYVALAQQAYLRDPLDSTIHYHQTESLRIMGRTEEALAAAKHRLRFSPNDQLAYLLAASVHDSDGRLDLALKSYYQAYRAHPDVTHYEAISRVFASLGERTLADAWLQEVDRRSGVSDWTKAFVALNRGDEDRAVQLVKQNVERGSYPVTSLAHIMMRAGIDLEQVRPIMEEGLRQAGRDPLEFNPEIPWIHHIDYVRILNRAGEEGSTEDLVRDMKTHFDKQIGERVKYNGSAENLHYLYAILLINTGDIDSALDHVEQAILGDGFFCPPCYQDRVFDDIRDNPRFVAILEGLTTRIETQRQRLEDEGMLLTPDEVVALEDFDFDPFAI